MKYFFYIAIALMLAVPFSMAVAVPDAVKKDVKTGIETTMGEAGLEAQKAKVSLDADAMSGNAAGLVGKIMNIILGALGVFFLTIAIHAGFLWMTSGGNEEKLAKAKNMITAAAIGMLLILGAYAVTWFVVYKIIWTTETSNIQQTPIH